MTKELPLSPSSDEVGFAARSVVRKCTSAALGTTQREEGYAYTSLCAFATGVTGHPVFLWSDLADHTQNIQKDNRISLLCEQASHRTNPQAGERVTLVGRVDKTHDEKLKNAFLRKHPSAQMYAQFGDFNFYSMDIEKAHYVGGFGKAVWVQKEHFLCSQDMVNGFQDKQEEFLKNLIDKDPNLANKLMEQKFGRNVEGCELCQIDPDGIDLRFQGNSVRIGFDTPLMKIEECAIYLHKKILS